MMTCWRIYSLSLLLGSVEEVEVGVLLDESRSLRVGGADLYGSNLGSIRNRSAWRKGSAMVPAVIGASQGLRDLNAMTPREVA